MNNPDYKPNVNSLRDYIYIFKKLMLNQRENFSKLNLAKTTLTLIKSPHSINFFEDDEIFFRNNLC